MTINRATNVLIFFLYLISIAGVAKKTILSDTLEYGNWSFSELIISYPNQFIRRGLIGELATIFDSNLVLFNTINIFIFINFIIFIILSNVHFKLSNFNSLQHFLYMISIFGVFNISIFNHYYQRKEMFVLNLFLISLLVIRTKLSNYTVFITMSLTSILMILIHEGIAMITIPFLVFISKNKISNFGNLLKIYTATILSTFLLVIISAGNESASTELWQGLSEFDRSLIYIEPNAITAIGWSLFDSFFITTQVLIFSGYMFLWIFYFLILAFTLLVIFKDGFQNLQFDLSAIKIFLKNNKYFLVIPILFIVGYDWGRWIFALFHLCFFTFMMFYKNNASFIKKWTPTIFIFITVSMLTIMPECCLNMSGTPISSNYFRIFKSMQITIMSLFS